MSDIQKKKEELKKAELRIFKLSNHKERTLSTYVQINIVNKQDGRIVSSKIMGIKTHGWLSFPMTDIVKYWIANPKSNQGLRIDITTIYGNGKVVEFATKNHIRREPIIVVFTKRTEGNSLDLLNLSLDTTLLNNVVKKKLNLRKRRSIKGEKNCHLAPLKVPIKEIGWEKKFVSPSELEINQCIGKCPAHLDKHTEHTNHAIFQTMYALVNTDVEVPCCAPATFEHENVILTDTKNGIKFVKLAVLDKLRVTSCQCL